MSNSNKSRPVECGTTLTERVLLNMSNMNEFMYRYISDGDKLILLSKHTLPNYYGKMVNIRTPKYCKSQTVCRHCMGELPEKLADPSNLPSMEDIASIIGTDQESAVSDVKVPTRIEYYNSQGFSGSKIDRPNDPIDEDFIRHCDGLKTVFDAFISYCKECAESVKDPMADKIKDYHGIAMNDRSPSYEMDRVLVRDAVKKIDVEVRVYCEGNDVAPENFKHYPYETKPENDNPVHRTKPSVLD